MAKIEFVKIVPTDAQIKTLYELLLEREHNISHKQTPTYEAHAEFVKSNPYRAWYIAVSDGKTIGAFYISEQNTIGINIVDPQSDNTVEHIMSYVIENYVPLPEIKSVRGPTFVINVSPGNAFLINALERLNKKVLQISYSIE